MIKRKKEAIAPKIIADLSTDMRKYFNMGAEGAANSYKARKNDWAQFEIFCNARSYPLLPSTPKAVSEYITYLAKKNRKHSTISRHLSSINKMHTLGGFEKPSTNGQIKTTLDGIRRDKGTEPEQSPVFDVAELAVKINKIDTSTISGKRDKAIILLGFTGAFRRSELASIEFSHLTIKEDDILVKLPRSKTNQHGKAEHKVIFQGNNKALCPVAAINDYLEATKIKEGFLFRRIRKGGILQTEKLSDKAINRTVKNILGEKYTGHSLRASFVTIAKMNGADDSEVMQQTGHKTSEMIRRYTRIQDKRKHNAAKKLGI